MVRKAERKIAYFSMEIGLVNSIPTYSGGLGVLAGDTLKAAADLCVPIVGVTLLSEKGYFTQILDQNGVQTETDTQWDLSQLKKLPGTVTVTIEGKECLIQAWEYIVKGCSGYTVPVLYLDTNLEQNAPEHRNLAAKLYGGDQRYRLAQEIVLGIGGLRTLRKQGYTAVNRHHMNEGHAALLALELFRTHAEHASCPLDDYDACMTGSMNEIRKFCVFTTHTPVAAGHDKFSYDLVRNVLGEFIPFELIQKLAGKDELNMTLLALNLSHYVNSVARQHQHVSTHLFPGYKFSNITNGVHSLTWTAQPFRQLYDRYIPNWRSDSFELRYALRIPETEVWNAHEKTKNDFVDFINKEYNANFQKDVFTIGFARRAATYKRMDLLFRNIERLRRIGRTWKLQIVFAGKAHPADEEGKKLIQKVFWHRGELGFDVNVVYLPDYDIDLAKVVIPGVDIWLNTPIRPKEASGTSGMKAAHNAVPHFSVLDGWWVEGHLENITGWSIGPAPTDENANNDSDDAEELYEKLEMIILPMYYEKRHKWMHVMRNTIAFNASFFNTHRMVQQYALNAYML